MLYLTYISDREGETMEINKIKFYQLRLTEEEHKKLKIKAAE